MANVKPGDIMNGYPVEGTIYLSPRGLLCRWVPGADEVGALSFVYVREDGKKLPEPGFWLSQRNLHILKAARV